MDQPGLEEVLKRAAAGEADAFGELYKQFHRRVIGLCRYLLGNPMDAEDAANDVFARLPQALQSYDASLPFPRWLLSVAGHRCVDALRRRRVEQRIFDSGPAEQPEASASDPTPLEVLLKRESRAQVRQALQALPERYRFPLTLRYYGELSYDEIAKTLGLNRQHVATVIFRAKGELHKKLAEAAGGKRV